MGNKLTIFGVIVFFIFAFIFMAAITDQIDTGPFVKDFILVDRDKGKYASSRYYMIKLGDDEQEKYIVVNKKVYDSVNKENYGKPHRITYYKNLYGNHTVKNITRVTNISSIQE